MLYFQIKYFEVFLFCIFKTHFEHYLLCMLKILFKSTLHIAVHRYKRCLRFFFNFKQKIIYF